MLSASLTFNFRNSPDPLAAGVSLATAGLDSVEAMTMALEGTGLTWFSRVLEPANVEYDYDGTFGSDNAFRFGTFPGFGNRATGSTVPITDAKGVPLDFTSLRAIILRVQPRVAYAPGAATGAILSDGTTPTDGDTVTIGSKTYTFKTALTPTEGQVLIAGSASAALLNLSRAILHTGTPGTDYSAAAAHPEVSAAATVTVVDSTNLYLVVTALVAGESGNALALSDTALTLTTSGTTLSGGSLLATPQTAQPLGGTVRFVLADGVLPEGVSDPSTLDITVSKPCLLPFLSDGPWTPAATSSLAVIFDDPATINAVATLYLIGDPAP